MRPTESPEVLSPPLAAHPLSLGLEWVGPHIPFQGVTGSCPGLSAPRFLIYSGLAVLNVQFTGHCLLIIRLTSRSWDIRYDTFLHLRDSTGKVSTSYKVLNPIGGMGLKKLDLNYHMTWISTFHICSKELEKYSSIELYINVPSNTTTKVTVIQVSIST